jgi:hypothetical protein
VPLGANDYVRLEIWRALQQRIRVIPVLLDDVDMPPPDQLPPDMRTLSTIGALQLSQGRWEYETSLLIAALGPIVARFQAPPAIARRSYLVPAVVSIVVLVTAGVLAWTWLSDLSHAVGTFEPLAQMVARVHTYLVRSEYVCSDGVASGIVVEVILDYQDREVPVVTWSGVTDKGRTIYRTPVLLKVSNGRSCPR